MSAAKYFKGGLLAFLNGAGANRAMRKGTWRSRRLLILCYHGISLHDEHEWNPELYMPLALFEERMASIRRLGVRVLPLADALHQLFAGQLREPSVALTFDDGFYDFYRQAWPVLRRYGYPATVYLTTYYCSFNRPVFPVCLSYLLWRGRDKPMALVALLGNETHYDSTTVEGRRVISLAFDRRVVSGQLSAQEKDALLGQAATLAGVDYREVLDRRLLHLMNPAEVKELSEAGVDFQLHTHRHRMPAEESSLRREIIDNRESILRYAGKSPVHLCYPSGQYQKGALTLLRDLGVESATTCDIGIATCSGDPLLLPRLVDTTVLTRTEFESWLSGPAALISRWWQSIRAARS